MKMKTIAHTRAQNAFILISVLLISVPALSQVNFISYGASSGSGFEKKFTGNLNFDNVISDPISRQLNSSVAYVNLSKTENVTNGEVFIGSEETGAKYAVSTKENNRNTGMENKEISIKPTSFIYPNNSKADVGISFYPEEQVILYAMKLKGYAKENGFDTSYAFFCNMGMLCHKKRFFVVNLVTLKIEESALVSHGRGQGSSMFDKQYSNKPGSRCTSLGRYKITGKYRGAYGESYRMVGLDLTNNNALNRSIVLHSMSCIPDAEVNRPACVSDGCPAVSTKFLASLNKIIDSRKKPVLLWIFDSNLEEVIIEQRQDLQIVSNK